MFESIRVNGKDGHDDTVSIDTTVQEKNITYPTDAKLHKKIITKCWQIASQHQLPVRQSYTQTLKKLSRAQRFRLHPEVKQKLWGGNFWTSGYYVNTVGQYANEDVILKYIQNQGAQKSGYKQLHKDQLSLVFG